MSTIRLPRTLNIDEANLARLHTLRAPGMAWLLANLHTIAERHHLCPAGCGNAYVVLAHHLRPGRGPHHLAARA